MLFHMFKVIFISTIGYIKKFKMAFSPVGLISSITTVCIRSSHWILFPVKPEFFQFFFDHLDCSFYCDSYIQIHIFSHTYLHCSSGVHFSSAGASACVHLNKFNEAITWCDKGLAVSFTKASIEISN